MPAFSAPYAAVANHNVRRPLTIGRQEAGSYVTIPTTMLFLSLPTRLGAVIEGFASS
jgi:hypothetical protein